MQMYDHLSGKEKDDFLTNLIDGSTMDNLLRGMNPRALIGSILPEINLPEHLTDQDLVRIIAEMFSEPEKRQKLPQFNTLDDAIALLQNRRKIIVVTGAGVSVSCGIPDFRSRNGIYARLHRDFPDLPNPQAMFDIDYFRENPRPFFQFASEIYPGRFKPSLCHMFISLLEKNNQLLRNYTQNIDALEQEAKIQRVIQCHGSFATASCFVCKYKVDSEYIRKDIITKKNPRCPMCRSQEELSILKPDITFFGEALSNEFHNTLECDKTQADLLIVIGSSMKVRPVSLIPCLVPSSVPQILINREPLPHLNFDIELLGDCDDMVHELCRRLGAPWNSLCMDSYLPLEQVLAVNPEEEPNKEQLKSASEKHEFGKEVIDTVQSTCESEAGGSGDKMKPETQLLHDMYKPRMWKLSSYLQKNTFLFMAPNRYVFKGAEFFQEFSDESSEDRSSVSDESAGGSLYTLTNSVPLNGQMESPEESHHNGDTVM